MPLRVDKEGGRGLMTISAAIPGATMGSQNDKTCMVFRLHGSLDGTLQWWTQVADSQRRWTKCGWTRVPIRKEDHMPRLRLHMPDTLDETDNVPDVYRFPLDDEFEEGHDPMIPTNRPGSPEDVLRTLDKLSATLDRLVDEFDPDDGPRSAA